MNGTTLIVISRKLRIFQDLDLLQLARLLGILNRIADLQVEAAGHDALHLCEHFRLENAVQEGIRFLR